MPMGVMYTVPEYLLCREFPSSGAGRVLRRGEAELGQAVL